MSVTGNKFDLMVAVAAVEGELKALRWMLDKIRPMFDEGYAYTCYVILADEAQARVEVLEKELAELKEEGGTLL